jgi:signal transduction histidine kinase
VTLADLVREVADWLRAEHPRVEVAIEHPLSSQTIEGDALELERVLLNLCRNAAESLPPEGGRVSLALREIGPPRELRLTVRDNGRGMDEAALGRIFEPFYSTKPGGTGIGLSAAREVVRRHRGTIMVESSPGEGTSFHVRLPLEDG